MKNYSYRKEYPFNKSVFSEKFIANTISSNPVEKIKRAYSDKKNDRVFVGSLDIKHGQFKVYTYPDLWDSFMNPILFFKRGFILVAPSCIYGKIVEEDAGRTVVDYTIDKTEIVKMTAVFGFFMCSLGVLGCIINLIENVINWEFLLASVIVAVFSISMFMMLQVPRVELDALIKFMEDLEV